MEDHALDAARQQGTLEVARVLADRLGSSGDRHFEQSRVSEIKVSRASGNGGTRSGGRAETRADGKSCAKTLHVLPAHAAHTGDLRASGSERHQYCPLLDKAKRPRS